MIILSELTHMQPLEIELLNLGISQKSYQCCPLTPEYVEVVSCLPTFRADKFWKNCDVIIARVDILDKYR